MTTCPACNGQKQTFAFVDGVDESGRRVARSGMVPCFTCQGVGEITPELAVRLEAGERRRRDRIDRGLSLREEAARLGITPSKLSHVEHGRMTEEEAGITPSPEGSS